MHLKEWPRINETKKKTIVPTSCVRMDKKASERTLGEKQNERVIE